MFNNNPQLNSLKAFFLLVVIAGSGYFIYGNVTNRDANLQQGKVMYDQKNQIVNPNNNNSNEKQICTANATLGSSYGDSCSVTTTSCTTVSGTTTQCTGALGNNYPCCCVDADHCYTGTLGGVVAGTGVPVKQNMDVEE